MEHMLSKSQPLDFDLAYKADVIISKVSFVNTICKPLQIHGCLCWLRNFDLSSIACKAMQLLLWLILKYDMFLKAFKLR